jgi:benzoylformate decarboxylase
VIFNNTSYKILKQRVRAMEGDVAQTNTYVGMDLLEPAIDFVPLARSMGVAAERVATLDGVRAKLKDALAMQQPTLLEVAIA